MFTIIGGDGKEYGPVSAEQIRTWITAGRANLDTKAKVVGTDEWRRLGDFAEFSSIPSAATSAPPVSTAPARVTGPVDAKAFADELIARAAPLDVFGCLGRSFELWKTNFLPLVGVTLLIALIQMVAGMIPVLGMLAGLLLTGIFNGGLYYFYLGKMRGEPRSVGDAFAGFSKAPGALIVSNLLITLITVAVALVFLGPTLFGFIRDAVAMQQSGGVPAMPSGIALVGLFIGIAIVVYLNIAWIFTFPLIIDRGLGPWTAMSVSLRVVSKQWFRVFFLMIVASILALLGVIAFFIGVLLTLPLLFGALLYAYEDLCNNGDATETPQLTT